MPAQTVARVEAAASVLREHVARSMRQGGTPGLSLIVTDRERTLHAESFGFADLAAGARVGPGTLFEIGSIGKSFTALVLLRLSERGVIDLGAPVTNYLPWFAVRSEYPPIALHHLLTHTAGIVGGTDLAQDGRFETWALRETAVSGPPGVHFRYSNVGYKTLGFVIEDLLGASYGDVVRREILDPLGMRDTVVPITNEARERMAVGYGRRHDDQPTRRDEPPVPLPWFESGTADGSLASTIADMAIYTRLHLNRGAHAGERIVSEDSYELMIRSHAQRPWGDETAGYGYGWVRAEPGGRPIEGHSGGMVGYFTALTIDRAAGLGVFVAINGPGDPFGIALDALRLVRVALAGEDPPDFPASDPFAIEDAAALDGVYPGERRTVRLVRSSETPAHLSLHLDDQPDVSRRVEVRGEYLRPTPPWDPFPVRVVRDGEAVVALAHGSDWYGREGVPQPPVAEHPAEWAAYPGRYRCWNPWGTNFRVISRRGQLFHLAPGAPEEPLTPLNGATFRLGEEPSPERITFDAVVAGEALRAVVDGQAYYRQPEW